MKTATQKAEIVSGGLLNVGSLANAITGVHQHVLDEDSSSGCASQFGKYQCVHVQSFSFLSLFCQAGAQINNITNINNTTIFKVL